MGARSLEQPTATSSVAQGSGIRGRVTPGGQPLTAPQAAPRSLLSSLWKCLGLGPKIHRGGPGAALWLAGWQLSPFNSQEIHRSRLYATAAESFLETPAFPFSALLVCLLINKQSSRGERRLGLRAACSAPAETRPEHSAARPQPAASARPAKFLSVFYWSPKCSQLAISPKPFLITASAVKGRAARDRCMR